MFSEQGLHSYGTPLPLLELDELPSKKPVYAQDQIATDEQGRRRFHGAFTGGFSAGYWNTVGSKEGWTPQSFKSSRSEKAAGRSAQRPEDFMDDEDRGEFGIAPKGLEIHEDFTASVTGADQRKRKLLRNDLQPIPGEPVLQQLLRPIKDKVAVRMLKTWGWRPGQGVGPRQTRKEKKKAKERNKKELYLMEKYGCELPTGDAGNSNSDNDDASAESEGSDDDITFAPEDYEAKPYAFSDNIYGLGYKPLSRDSVLGSLPTSSSSSETAATSSALALREHINLFKPLEAVGKNNKKISFAGQAFGVGALEEDDDEDVYATDDLRRYDFSLEDKKKTKKPSRQLQKEEIVFENFILDLNPEKPQAYRVEMPFGWQPRNWYEKRSRFEPMDARQQKQLERKMAQAEQAGEKTMTRQKRAELLGEQLQEPSKEANAIPRVLVKPSIMELQKQQKERQQKTQSLLEKISAKSSSFTKGGIITLEGEEKGLDALTAEEISTSFKPFMSNAQKQKRYEQFLATNLSNEKDIEEFLKTIQPLELSPWDRQMELKEFIQAKKLYRPLQGIMSDRFVTESEVKADQKVAEVKRSEAASKQIVVERSKVMWKPQSLLCKRFNIAEPFGGMMEDEKKSKRKPKLSVFDYLETSVNRKEDFQTPIIIPKNVEKPQEIVKQPGAEEKQSPASEPLEWQNVLEGKEAQRSEAKTEAKFKPKTDLERQVVESLEKPIAEKKELFKSIFSDSESDAEDAADEDEGNGNKSKVEFMASLAKPVSAAAANLLRNNSPPRGIFKALFNVPSKTVDLTKDEPIIDSIDLTGSNAKDSNNEAIKAQSPEEKSQGPRIVFQPKSNRTLSSHANTAASAAITASTMGDSNLPQQPETKNTYGPALPTSSAAPAAKADLNLDDKLLTLWNKHKTSAHVTEVWVEKSSQAADSSEDSDEDSSSSDASCSSDDLASKQKTKKSKKFKKKKSSSDHKHKKHKEHRSSKKSKKSEKKKKKHKKK